MKWMGCKSTPHLNKHVYYWRTIEWKGKVTKIKINKRIKENNCLHSPPHLPSNISTDQNQQKSMFTLSHSIHICDFICQEVKKIMSKGGEKYFKERVELLCTDNVKDFYTGNY